MPLDGDYDISLQRRVELRKNLFPDLNGRSIGHTIVAHMATAAA